MKTIKTFETFEINEAAKQGKEKEALDCICSELEKKQMTRFQMINCLKDKFGEKIAQKIADEVIHSGTVCGKKVSSKSYKEKPGRDGGKAYWWIGSNAKAPNTKEETKKEYVGSAAKAKEEIEKRKMNL